MFQLCASADLQYPVWKCGPSTSSSCEVSDPCRKGAGPRHKKHALTTQSWTLTGTEHLDLMGKTCWKPNNMRHNEPSDPSSSRVSARADVGRRAGGFAGFSTCTVAPPTLCRAPVGSCFHLARWLRPGGALPPGSVKPALMPEHCPNPTLSAV